MVFGRLKSFDLYPKLADDVRVKTFSGAAVSLIAAGAIILLVISELLIYLSPVRADRLFVDVSRGEQLPISVDVTFPRIPCQLLSLQTMDVAGSDQIMLTHQFIKEPLDANGNRIGPSTNYTLGRDIVLFGSSPAPSASPAAASTGSCGSCYGAERHEGDCCRTCADVRVRHEEKGLAKGVNDAEWEQCITEEALRASSDLSAGHGCRIHGSVRVTKVAGNIFLVPGRPALAAAVANAAGIDARKLDARHTVNSLQFGKVYPGIASPLDGVTKPAPPNAGDKSAHNRNAGSHDTAPLQSMFMYYVKVIPTVFTSGGEVVHTNQYSVTEHAKPLTLSSDATQQKSGPGVYFFYELSPIMVRTTETRPPVLHFVTQLCAIVGGVFTVAGMVDRFIYAGMVHARGNVQLGTKVN